VSLLWKSLSAGEGGPGLSVSGNGSNVHGDRGSHNSVLVDLNYALGGFIKGFETFQRV